MSFGLRITTTGQGASMVIEVEVDGTIVAHGLLTASEADAFIRNFALWRSQLKEEVPHELTPQLDTGRPVQETAFGVKWLNDRPGKALCLRHPGLGWMTFVLQPDQCALAAQGLLAERLDKDRTLQ